MALSKKTKSVPNDVNAVDYRYPNEKRTNIPPGRIAGEGIVPKVPKVRYAYSPHLPPRLQFDPVGEPDKLKELVEKAMRTPLSAVEAAQLRDALHKDEPWLEWSGKREKRWFEVDPVALHMHERISTQAILRVAAREDVQRNLFADPQQDYTKAVQFYQHDMDWTNRMILGDSLQVMTSLARREGLAGKVQMIYLDPPYGIKFASNFQPQFDQRDVKDRDQDLTREPETVKAYRDTWTLGIHSYLSYLRDRLTMVRELLTDSGSIFVQISDENLHRVRCMMDEVFGASNFVSVITFVKTTSATGEHLGTISDYILWYARDKVKVKFKRIYLTKELGEEGTSQYVYAETPSGETRRLSGDEQNDFAGLPDDWTIFAADNCTSSRPASQNEAQEIVAFGRSFPRRKGSFKTNIEGFKRLELSDRLFVIGESLMYRRLSGDFAVREVNNIWRDTLMTGFSEPKLYVVQTSQKVIARCLQMTTDPGDLVLDPTCGSGTTAYVAEQWGRRWITCDSSRVALALAKHRLITAKFDYYKLRPLNAEDVLRNSSGTWLSDPMRTLSGKVTLQCKTIPHIQLSSIARNASLDPIFSRHTPILADRLNTLNSEVAKVSKQLQEKLVEKLIQKHREDGGSAVTDSDRRRWLLPDTHHSLIKSFPNRKPFKGMTPKQADGYRSEIPKGGWKEWEVPFDTDPDWPKSMIEALTSFRAAWRAKMDEVNGCIKANAEIVELVDKPDPVKGVVRVSGPFTLEGVRPEEFDLGNASPVDGQTNEREDEESRNLGAMHQQNLQAYLGQMVQLMHQDGLTFINNKRHRFSKVETLFDDATGTVLHAEGSWDDSKSPDVLEVAIGFGPQYGPVTAQQVEGLIHASKRHSELVVAGFSFDADATALIKEQSHPKLRIHQAYIRPDVNPGMAGLLKETSDSQLFTVFGVPEIEVSETEAGDWVVQLTGVDVYNPIQNTIRSTGADKVAAWFLDSDFDGRCFCITQAFFPFQDAWEKIAKALGSAADVDAFEAFNGTKSIPFPAGKYKRVAVKVIDPRGNEVMAVRALEA